MKKLIITVALLLSMILLSVSCAAPSEGADTASTESGAEQPLSGDGTQGITSALTGDDIVIFDNAHSDYTLIRADDSSQTVTDALVDLKNVIRDRSGALLAIRTDWEKGIGKDDTVENDSKEILVGYCNRKESKAVFDTLEPSGYAIRVVNGKLVIIGADDYATANAVTAFIESYLGTAISTLTLPGGLSLDGRASIQKIALTSGADIRVMSFNTLGTGGEYDSRRPNEIQLILDYLPDVIGVQEANARVHTDILLASPIREYYSVNVRSHTGKSTVNYTPILYLKSKYELVEGGVEWLNSRYTETNTKSLSWAVLENITTGQRFAVVNMHGSLWASTYALPAGETYESMRAKAVLWRADNAKQMADKVDSLVKKYDGIPALTTGDFNFNSSADAYKVLIDRDLTDSQTAATVSATKGINSYHSVVGAKPDTGLCIDRVFFTAQNLTALKFVICTRQLDLDASDHCPVYADLKFIK